MRAANEVAEPTNRDLQEVDLSDGSNRRRITRNYRIGRLFAVGGLVDQARQDIGAFRPATLNAAGTRLVPLK